VTTAPAVEGTRERILDVALRLFAENSFAGTSLQMIADEMGLTKAAVYHHFHTREELLRTLVQPALDEMVAVTDVAAGQRTPHARAEHFLTGFIDLALRHRKLTAILGTDQAVTQQLLRSQAHFEEVVGRPLAMLSAVAPGPAGRVNATLALAGIASTAGSELLADLDDDTMRRHLAETVRRVLGLRAPRPHRPSTGSPGSGT